jgi:P-type Cu+ transporter
MSEKTIDESKKIGCYHCGEDCDNTSIHKEEKIFCCEGCKMVFEIINENGLCEYYDLDKNPGIAQKTKVREGKFAFLGNAEVISKLVHFSEGNQMHITFYLPQMHCSSCIWLLEHLPKLHKGVIQSQVNFLKKEITVVFDSTRVTLKVLAELLSEIGYEPHISLNDLSDSKISKYDKSRLYKIGIAGFCFGNIMMLSFPEYFSNGTDSDKSLQTIFSFINLGLALPVFFYCASEFFTSAYKSLKQKFLNIDAPIALAILITFARSIYEITSFSGPGYLDSMSGIVFFMLVGRFFQNKSYDTLNFDRDYKSYFPLGVTVLNNDATETQIPVSELKKGNRIKIHNSEIVPADGILFMGKATIDYSFVTGESTPVEKSIGEIIYAGGKQCSGAIELEVVKEVSQSYLTQLWNNTAFKNKKNQPKDSFIHLISRYFTYGLFSIALAAGIYWSINSSGLAWNAVTSILIVACPCALLLSATFTNGNMISVLQKYNFFVKNAEVLETISQTDTLVFDKTGTITRQDTSSASFKGCDLNDYQLQLIRMLATQSSHPLSKAIAASIPFQKKLTVKNYVEEAGKGSSALINNESIRMGSSEFITGASSKESNEGSKVYVSHNEQVLGWYYIKTPYRENLSEVMNGLKQNYQLALISGDTTTEEAYLKNLFGKEVELHFNKKPQDKLDYIKNLQNKGHKVLMIGDGLNDAGALQQSEVGIAISDNINNFSPGSDIILDGKSFSKLNTLLDYCRKEKQIIYGSFIISLIYNVVGLSFAVQGTLSPVIAAILMPISSISIVLYTTFASRWFARKLG